MTRLPSSLRRLPLLLSLGALLLALGPAGACRQADDRQPARATATQAGPAFVGGTVCTECHAAEAALWRGSFHARAMQPAASHTVLGDFNGATFTYNGITSTFRQQDGRSIVRTDGPDGSLTDYPVKWAFGAEPLQQYVVDFPRGYQQLPSIAWDSRPAAEGGRRWFHLYPSEAFITEIGGSLGRPPAGISRVARQALLDYHWPGNVRELRNILERAAILCYAV